jgi:oligopeptide/dipeptide ABC transporter ATP-binding protein
MSAPLLEARSVRREFGGGLFEGKRLVAVTGASLLLPADKPVVIAIAGESGSGKTTLARLLLGMLPPSAGSILYEGTDLTDLDPGQRQTFRRQVQAVFQDPFGVFNPFYRVDHTLEMPLRRFFPELSRAQRRERIEVGLGAVGLRAEETLGRYPHQLSGGQRQRIMVTRALLLDPRVIVADEPVSMVDASLRATILESLFRIHQERGISLVYITHDLTTAYQLSHTILIMYRGDVVEMGDVDLVIKAPRHPYTQLLVRSIPLADTRRRWGEDSASPVGDGPPVPALSAAPGTEAEPMANDGSCPFADLCPHVMPRCQQGNPSLLLTDPGRAAACYLYDDAAPVSQRQLAALSHGGA